MASGSEGSGKMRDLVRDEPEAEGGANRLPDVPAPVPYTVVTDGRSADDEAEPTILPDAGRAAPVLVVVAEGLGRRGSSWSVAHGVDDRS